jgi:hypothetical protein
MTYSAPSAVWLFECIDGVMPFFDAAIPWHLIRKVRAPSDEEAAIRNPCEGSGKAELAGQIWQTHPIR